MKLNINFLILLITILFISFGCSNEKESVELETYTGKVLHIGIIGEEPKIKEENIQFTGMNFTDLQNTDKYDAIFITKENLKEAAKAQYTTVYTSSPIPFLFIQSDKGHIPFINEDVDFKDSPNVDSDAYAHLYDGKSSQYWGYGLYDDIENEQNIQNVYSRVFKTIEELSVTNLSNR